MTMRGHCSSPPLSADKRGCQKCSRLASRHSFSTPGTRICSAFGTTAAGILLVKVFPDLFDVRFTSGITDEGYGLVTHFEMPGGVNVQLYEARY